MATFIIGGRKTIKDLFLKPKIITICGDVHTGKSNLAHWVIQELIKEGSFNLYTYGFRSLPDVKSQQIFTVKELEEVRNSIIILDEVMSLWDLDNRKSKKMIENTLRLINHNNNVLVLVTVPENLKKFISGKIDYYLFKKVTFHDFINGSSAKHIATDYKGAERGSEVLNLAVNETLLYDGKHYCKLEVPYIGKHDAKKDLPSIITATKLNHGNKSVPKSVQKNVSKNVQKV